MLKLRKFGIFFMLLSVLTGISATSWAETHKGDSAPKPVPPGGNDPRDRSVELFR